MSDYLWLLGFAAGTVVVLLLANLWFKPYFRRIALCWVPLALAGWVAGEAITRQTALPVTVTAGTVTDTPGVRLDKSVEFRAETITTQGQERVATPVPAISLSTVETIARRWYQSQIELVKAKEKDKTKIQPDPETLFEVKGAGESTGSWFWEKHELAQFSFKIPADFPGQASSLVGTIASALNQPRGFRFNMGVDLAGGTILVYEAQTPKGQEEKELSEQEAAELAIALKKRIDPANLREITIRPIKGKPPRVEIILPMRSASGSAASADIAEIKSLISRVGSLEFRILADRRDDSDVIDAAKNLLPAEGLVPKLENIPSPDPDVWAWVEFADEAYERIQDMQKQTKLTPGFNSLAQEFPIYYAPDVVDPMDPSKKKDRFFVLTRIPKDKYDRVRGEDLGNIRVGMDQGRQVVHFGVNSPGDTYMSNLTSPKKGRMLAVVLDNRVTSYATINDALSSSIQVTMGSGNATEVHKRVQALLRVLKSGALPATLKSEPVSELSMGPGLGADTIQKGARAVVVAFIAVVVFMVVYYRFAGTVASAALFANLLLTIGFMVAVKAAFTLPGLAGLVLMLGMAVDANVLIYERIREERERGAGLALAIRNGYDRAFPTIIDTHLTSIFTAVVLYAVGNDQLKGFGVSLTSGLVISLFTSLYMTRLIFDVFLAKNLLHKLSMFKLFSRPNIDFMGVRYYWFTATVVLSVLGLLVFVLRGDDGLNIDFTGGTAYSVEFKQAKNVETVRKDAQRAVDPNDPTKLKDVSVDAISKEGIASDETRTFTFRTTLRKEWKDEMQTAEVRRNIVEVFGDQLVMLEPKATKPEPLKDHAKFDRQVEFTVVNNLGEKERLADRSVFKFVNNFLSARNVGRPDDFYETKGVGDPDNQGLYASVLLRYKMPEEQLLDDPKLEDKMVEQVLANLHMPKSPRLENFNSQLADEVRQKALLAIALSWMAISGYLWFRFGNWTFGVAAVLCLIHDLMFTIGLIGLSHYLSVYTPIGGWLLLEDFKLDLPSVAALLTLVGYSVNDTIVVFDRIREVRGKSPELTPKMINDSVNQTLSRTILTSLTTWIVVVVLYLFGGEGVHLFSFVMVVGVIIGTYSSIFVASPLLLIFGEGKPTHGRVQLQPQEVGA
jgi:SecD/SecF fusion protein